MPQSRLPPPSRVPPPSKFRDSVTAPPQERAQRGVSSPGGGGEKGGLGSSAPAVTPVCPAPSGSPAHSPGTSFRESTDVQRRLPAAPQPPTPLPCLRLLSLPFCQARPASVGNVPGHLYSRPRANCLVSSLPIHRRVTLPQNFTPGRGGRGIQEWGEGLGGTVTRNVATSGRQ